MAFSFNSSRVREDSEKSTDTLFGVGRRGNELPDGTPTKKAGRLKNVDLWKRL
jgi:hypothetical protein